MSKSVFWAISALILITAVGWPLLLLASLQGWVKESLWGIVGILTICSLSSILSLHDLWNLLRKWRIEHEFREWFVSQEVVDKFLMEAARVLHAADVKKGESQSALSRNEDPAAERGLENVLESWQTTFQERWVSFWKWHDGAEALGYLVHPKYKMYLNGPPAPEPKESPAEPPA